MPEIIKELFLAGIYALNDYIVAHVVTCLIPAFLLAGAMVTFVNKQVILSYFGEKIGKFKSFSLASVSSFFVAACSCTIIPVASGLYFSGAGIGVSFIILWMAPAANVLALTYTGSILGSSIVIARLISALAIAFVVGWVMTLFFGRENVKDIYPEQIGGNQKIIDNKELIFILLILLSLLLPNYLGRVYWVKVSIWISLTLIVLAYAFIFLTKEKIKDWLIESWWFVKMIFPLLLLGIFIVGIIGKIVPEDFIRKYLGDNSLLSSFLSTLIGAVSYFSTMTESPFVDTLMKSGMAKGPGLALLLTGPGVSLPNFIVISRVFGIKKALVYILTIIISGTLVGWIFGNFVF
ncbi:MAG: permease [Brevinematia bacterium]